MGELLVFHALNFRPAGKRKGPGTFRAFLYGGGVRTPVQIRSPRPLGKYRVLVPAFGDCPFRIVKNDSSIYSQILATIGVSHTGQFGMPQVVIPTRGLTLS